MNRSTIARLFAAICLMMVLACPAWAGSITPVIGNSIMGRADIVSDPLSPILMPNPIFVYQPDRSWISAYADGLKSTTSARTSAQTYVDADGVLRIAPANVPATENGYVMLEGAATSYYWQPYTESGGAITAIEAPVTRTVTLPNTGDYVLWIDGNASLSVTVAANTAAGTGWGTLTESGSLKLSITTAGTVDVTVSDGAANDIVQLTTGVVKTSYIPTPTSTPVTRTTSASDTSGNGLQVDLTQRMIDVFRGELINWTNLWFAEGSSVPSGLMPVASNGNRTQTSPGGVFTSIPIVHPSSSTSGVTIGVTQVEVSLTVSDCTQGQVRFECGYPPGNLDTGSISTNGTYTYRGVFKGDLRIRIFMTNSFDGSITVNYVRRVLSDGTTNRGEGTLIQSVDLPFSGNEMPPSGGNSIVNIVNPNNAIFTGGLMVQRGSSSQYPARLSDGVTYTNLIDTIQSGRYVLISQWSAVTGQMRVGLWNPVTKTLKWSGYVAYRGFFPIHASNKLRWFYGGTMPIGIGGCALYDTILTDDEIIRAAQALQ